MNLQPCPASRNARQLVLGWLIFGALIATSWSMNALAADREDVNEVASDPSLSVVFEGDEFWMFQPYDGAPAPLHTTVLAACSADHLVLRMKAAGEIGSGIVAPQVRRDQVADDQDHVTFYLDPSSSGASAIFFRVGAGGSMSDGVYYATSNRHDFQPDFDVTAAAESLLDAYQVTLEIPRSLLSAQGMSQGHMRFLVTRNVPGHTRRLFASSPLAVNTTNLMSVVQELDASDCGAPVSNTSFAASYTATRDKRTAGVASFQADSSELGADLRWTDGATTSADLTFNPDFSQVELDVPQLQSNMRFSIYLPEKRDFFLRDGDMFELPTRSSLNEGGGNQAFYSRTITDPEVGARVARRTGGVNLAFLAAQDDGGGVVSLPGPFYTRFIDQPSSSIAFTRASRQTSNELQYGAIVGARRYSADLGSNAVVGADLSWRPNETMRSRGMAIVSRTDAFTNADGLAGGGESANGSYLFWDITKAGQKWETAWTAEHASQDFRNDMGYTPQADFTQIAGLLIRRWRPAGYINNIGASIKMIAGNTSSTNELINRRLAPGIWFGGARDLDLFLEYVPEERRRTTGYGGKIHSTDQVNFRLGGKVSNAIPYASLSINVGDQVDYELDRVGSGYTASLSLRWRPIEWLEFQPVFSRYQVKNDAVADQVEETTGQLIVNAIMSPHSFVRYIGQSRSNHRFGNSVTASPDIWDGSWVTFRDNRDVLHSLVYSVDISKRWGVDVGATRSRASSLTQDNRYETNFFLKIEGNWHR